jgi:hypothetical protein
VRVALAPGFRDEGGGLSYNCGRVLTGSGCGR